MEIARVTCVFMLCLAVVFPIRGQQASCETHTVIIGVRDKRGGFVPDLQTSDFRAKPRGSQLRILSAAHGTEVHYVVLAVDVSGSMDAKHDAIVEMASETLRTFPNDTQIALVMFSDRILETVEFGHSRQEVFEVMSRVRGSQGARTALRDSLLYAVHLLGTGERGDSVIAFSDGGDNQSKTSLEKVVAAYISKGVRLSAVIPVDRYLQQTQTPEERNGWLDLQSIAGATGGAIRIIQGRKEIGKVHDLADELGHYYVLQIATPRFEKRSHWQPEVVDRSGKQRKDLELSFPQDIVPTCVGG